MGHINKENIQSSSHEKKYQGKDLDNDMGLGFIKKKKKRSQGRLLQEMSFGQRTNEDVPQLSLITSSQAEGKNRTDVLCQNQFGVFESWQKPVWGQRT